MLVGVYGSKELFINEYRCAAAVSFFDDTSDVGQHSMEVP